MAAKFRHTNQSTTTTTSDTPPQPPPDNSQDFYFEGNDVREDGNEISEAQKCLMCHDFYRREETAGCILCQRCFTSNDDEENFNNFLIKCADLAKTHFSGRPMSPAGMDNAKT